MPGRRGDNWLTRVTRPGLGRAHPAPTREGDEVGGFTVLETPGHCAGHVSFWRAGGRVLRRRATPPGPSLPPAGRPRRPARAAGAFSPRPGGEPPLGPRRVAARPRVVLFGHGPALRDPAALPAFAAALPAA